MCINNERVTSSLRSFPCPFADEVLDLLPLILLPLWIFILNSVNVSKDYSSQLSVTVVMAGKLLGKRRRTNGMYTKYAKKKKMQMSRLRRRNTRSGGFLGIEVKFLDTSLANSSITNPSDASGGEHDPTTVACLNAVAQGDGESNRDGKDYLIRSLHVRGHIKQASQADQTAADTPQGVFVACVLDTQTNAAQLNSEDVFKNPSGSTNLADHPFRNLQYSRRFKILWSKHIVFQGHQMVYDGTNIEQAGIRRGFEFNLPNLNIKVQTKGTSANVTDIVDNSIHMIAYSTSIEPQSLIEYNARIRFVG